MSTVVSQVVEQRGDRPALVDEHTTRSWPELDDRVDRIGAWLSAAVASDETVALYAGNSVEGYETLLASMFSSTTIVPVNRHFAVPELAYVLDDANSTVLVTDTDHRDRATAAARSLGRPIDIVVTDDPEHSLDMRIEGVDRLAPAAQGAGPVMFYTSGTTGRPKGVRSSAFERGGSIETVRDVGMLMCSGLGIPLDGTTLLIGPAYHSAQWALSVFPFLNGSTLVTTRRFDAEDTLRQIERHGVTNFHAVPTQFIRMLQLDEETRGTYDVSSLAVVVHGAAACPPSVKREMIDWFGPKVTEYYGATEAGFVTAITADEWLERPTSVGKPLPIFDVAVLGSDGEPRPTGEDGEIWVRSLVGNDFEYHGDEQKTAANHRGDLFTVGDIGSVDADGYVHLSDRKIDMIISGGVNIYPAEIEHALVEHPAVGAAAVIGVPNAEYGEEVKALVELAPGVEWNDATAAELDAWCRERLAGYKRPRSFERLEELPRNEAGKVLKRKLRERVTTSSAQRDAEAP